MGMYLFFVLCWMMMNCVGGEILGLGESSEDINPRKGKHDLLFLFSGFHSLVAFFILKVKIVIVVITVIAGTLLALKFFGLLKYSNYVYKSNYPIIDASPPHVYGNYPSASVMEDEKFNGDYSSDFGRIQRRNLENFVGGFFGGVEEILLGLMNPGDEECRGRSAWRVTSPLASSGGVSGKLSPPCAKMRTTRKHTRKRRVR